MGAHNDFGKTGEQMAVDYLVKDGYSIKRRNYRYLKGEIDIIAQKGEILAIVEVKSRSVDFLQDIGDTITKKKIKLLVRTADHYVVSRDLDVEVRFDLFIILKDKGGFTMEHIENAFYHF
ncbi:putative endonuclease [Arenibacter nanhaiticus]|uniref:UPF0102 protein SAMN04487911_13234 n=1 Tax=Arenibacter nanhaiticus TaxID=558155 RepID=A0A1M6LLZ1_9FLAO|nr:YraN family protein [Arenibacter nanhaiticus]SHJ72197.1 putative endonuclease [Arenibacter nanhaiticus]